MRVVQNVSPLFNLSGPQSHELSPKALDDLDLVNRLSEGRVDLTYGR